MEIDVRLLGAEEVHVLAHVAADVFDDAVDPHLASEFVADPRHHLAVALDGDTVVGMASAVDYVHPDKPAELWINEVGVAPAYQRMGIGRRLLQTLFAAGVGRGCRNAWVLTEGDNVAARGLYAAAGGDEDATVMYTFSLTSTMSPYEEAPHTGV